MTEQVRISPADLHESADNGHECRVSFVVPAFQARRTLTATIESLRQVALPASEIIVVDDGSLDETAALASRLADVVVNRPCQGGAARSRNDGARVARGRILFFVDSDVTVNTKAVVGAIRHIDEGADAVFGAYEPLPPPEVRNPPTTYKNLLHHYTHLQAAGEAQTFWSGFGAVRREAFMAVHGFDPAVTTGADVEDIHLGYRLRAAGFRIVLDPTLQVQHHKHYTVRGIIASDVFHRAIPWTRALLQLHTFSNDLNLRRQSMFAGLLSLTICGALGLTWWVGPAALVAAGALLGLWLLLHRHFLWFVLRSWNLRGMLWSASLLFLYYLYGVLGTAMGAAAFVLRRGRTPMLNWLRLEGNDTPTPELAVSVAVIAVPGEPLAALEALPPLESWCELLVVCEEEPPSLTAGARYLRAPKGATRNEMRQLALTECQGEMFATLDARCAPVPGWLEQVRLAADGALLVVAGPFDHDRTGVLRRAEQVVRYWQWRPERGPAWLVHHPSTNTAFRTTVARKLGGFQVEGALILRLAGFGARPVRFDPKMQVALTTGSNLWDFVRGTAGVSRLRSSASVRYFDIGWLHRIVLVGFSPVAGLISLGRIVRQAVTERTADRTFWLALPLIAIGLASHWLGRDVGLLRVKLRGGLVPQSSEDLATLGQEAPVASLGDTGPGHGPRPAPARR